MSKVFEAGYYVEVFTWENDYDNRKYSTLHFTSKEHLAFCVKILEYFAQDKLGGTDGYFSNCKPSYVDNLANELLTWATSQGVSSAALSEYIYEYVGMSQEGSEYWRVVESFETYFVPERIEFNSVQLD